MTSRSSWKKFESVIAEAWTAAIGLLCKRNILSGANNRTDDGKCRPGDVVIHRDFNADVLIEAKYRASHAHHTLFRAAEADARKHGLKHTLLYTRVKREEGYLVVMSADLFHALLALEPVQLILKKSAQETDPQSDGGSSRSVSPKRKGSKRPPSDDERR